MHTRAVISLLEAIAVVGQVQTCASAFRPNESEFSGSDDPTTEVGRLQFNFWVILPLTIGFLVIAVVVCVRFCYRSRQRKREMVVESPRYRFHLPSSEPYEEHSDRSVVWHTLSIETHTNPFGLNQTYRVQSTEEMDEILPKLFECPDLVGKRVPIQSLHFKATLSNGASGEVWLGQFNNQQVAVKQLLRTNEHTLKDVEEFVDEIVLTASLSHLHIVSFIGVAWSSLDNVAMVMEYCPMGDLKRFLAESGRLLSWSRDKVRMAVGIAQALRYIHERNPPIIHRDLKSMNILLTETLETKISDFGVSRSRKDGFMTAGVGTPYWIAPEILEGKRYTEQADIYSFGVVLSELDTCKMPFSEVLTAEGKKPKPFQILNWVLDGSLTLSFSEECPRWIRSVGTQCLQHDPDLRPTAAELTQVLWTDVRHRIYTL